jgi:hypothetical protein
MFQKDHDKSINGKNDNFIFKFNDFTNEYNVF